MTRQHIDTLIEFLRGQMDGNPVPPHNSAEMKDLAGAIQAALQLDSARDLCELGLRALGLAIDKARSGVAYEAALRAISAPGGDHD